MKESLKFKCGLYKQVEYIIEIYNAAKISFLAKSVLFDFLFFILLSIVYTLFYFKIADKLNALNTLISSMSTDISAMNVTSPTQAAFSSMLSTKESIMQGFWSLLTYICLLLICVYVLWCIFQGTNWHIANKYACKGKQKKKGDVIGYWAYMRNFSILSLIWAAAFLVIAYLLIKFSTKVSFQSIELIDARLLAQILGVFLLIMAYFLFVGYSIKEKKLLAVLGGVFIKGIKKIKHYGIVYLIGCVKIYIIVRLIMLLDIGLISFVLLNFFFISIVMAWMRLGMARAGTNIV